MKTGGPQIGDGSCRNFFSLSRASGGCKFKETEQAEPSGTGMSWVRPATRLQTHAGDIHDVHGERMWMGLDGITPMRECWGQCSDFSSGLLNSKMGVGEKNEVAFVLVEEKVCCLMLCFHL